MKILLASHVFAPAVGGIETMSATLADEFTRQGHDVKVVTQTPSPAQDALPYEVVRHPGKRHLLRLVQWCDIFFHNNISLHTVWAVLIVHKPWVVAHHTWLSRVDGSVGWQDKLKRLCIRYATNITISRAMASHLPTASTTVIGNCYRDDLFHQMPDVVREKELVFLGRLVSDKGADVLLEALSLLRAQGLMPRLTVVGDGPEREPLRELAEKLQIVESVCFVGAKSGDELVWLLNRHRIMVVPSRWQEPFGIVALEGIACGCVVVGSEGGGLKDAIGPCGITFPNGDAPALAWVLSELLTDPQRQEEYRRQAPAHLARHTPAAVAAAYLEVFEAARR